MQRLILEWSYDNVSYQKIGSFFHTTKFSDEYCKYEEFTGTMVGLTCVDRVRHRHYAAFDFFEYLAEEGRGSSELYALQDDNKTLQNILTSTLGNDIL